MFRHMVLATRLRAELPHVTGVRNGVDPVWSAAPSAADVVRANLIVSDTLAEFPDEQLTEEEAARLEADARLDRLSDADLLAVAVAARALPPGATAAEIRARAKADRRARGGQP